MVDVDQRDHQHRRWYRNQDAGAEIGTPPSLRRRSRSSPLVRPPPSAPLSGAVADDARACVRGDAPSPRDRLPSLGGGRLEDGISAAPEPPPARGELVQALLEDITGEVGP